MRKDGSSPSCSPRRNGTSSCGTLSASTHVLPWGSFVWGKRSVTWSETALDTGWRLFVKSAEPQPSRRSETYPTTSSLRGLSQRVTSGEKEIDSNEEHGSGVSRRPRHSDRTSTPSSGKGRRERDVRLFEKHLKEDLGDTKPGWLWRSYMAELKKKRSTWSEKMAERKGAYRESKR